MSSKSQLGYANAPNYRQHGMAWVFLCLALAVHVLDEALTDFLSVYNPAVQALGERLPFLLLPTFTFKIWLTGLVVGVSLLLFLSHFVFRGSRWMILASYIFAIVMLGNGLGHIAGSFYLGRLMPGVYSAPLLLGCSIYLLVCTYQSRKLASESGGLTTHL